MTIATESGHWYDREGNPVYEIEGANGKLRPTTIRDARKLGLVPGYSTIEKCAYKYNLENWKIKQHLLTTVSAPCLEGEEVEKFIARIQSETQERMNSPRDLGSSIHTAIEKCLAGKQYTHQDHVAGALKALREWCGSSPMSSEKSFAHPLGYGGRVDVHKQGWVADFKTKEFTEDNLPETWPNHSMQLAAYRMGLNMPTARCAIIFVSTTEPGLTHLVEIPNSELERGWRMFRALLTYWQEDKQYQTELELVEA